MEERYIQPISAGHPRTPAGANRPANTGHMGSMPNSGMPNAGTPNHLSNTLHANTGAMPYMMNNMNAGMMPEMTPAKPNMGAMPEMTTEKPKTGMMPEMNQPNYSTLPYMAKPNTGMMPEMAPAKPNTGMLPETAAKPNTGTMPSTMNSPNTGAMPYMAKPNTGLMPEMTPAKPNTGMMPETAAKPNTGTMPSTMNSPNTGAMPYMAKPNTGMLPEMTQMPNMNAENDMSGCGYKNGELPPCAPLAAGFVPFQQKNPPKYGTNDALTRGTLFPGLDLPFMNMTNKTNPYAGTPRGELMALGFVIKELNLYLDTHSKDKDALDMLKSLNKLMQEGREKYTKLYGPLSIMDIMSGDTFEWLDNPWPWEYNDKGASENHV